MDDPAVFIKREIGDNDAAMWRTLYQQRGEEILRLRAQLDADPLISIAQSLATLASCVSDHDATYKYLRTQPHG